MRAIFFSLFLMTFFFACSGEQKAKSGEQGGPDISKDLLGTWEVKYLKVDIETELGRDTSYTFEVNEGDWDKKFAVQPFRTFFAADSTFHTVRRSRNGTLIGEDRGLWRTFGDTLMLLQPDATLQYKVLLLNGQAEWAGVIDWDQDGSDDDTYYATYRYVGRTSNE